VIATLTFHWFNPASGRDEAVEFPSLHDPGEPCVTAFPQYFTAVA
jgi:hypothetical protein